MRAIARNFRAARGVPTTQDKERIRDKLEKLGILDNEEKVGRLKEVKKAMENMPSSLDAERTDMVLLVANRLATIGELKGNALRTEDADGMCMLLLQHGAPNFVQNTFRNVPVNLKQLEDDSELITKNGRIGVVSAVRRCLTGNADGSCHLPLSNDGWKTLFDVLEQYVARINNQHPTPAEVAALKLEFMNDAMTVIGQARSSPLPEIRQFAAVSLVNGALSLVADNHSVGRKAYTDRARWSNLNVPGHWQTFERVEPRIVNGRRTQCRVLPPAVTVYTSSPSLKLRCEDFRRVTVPVYAYVLRLLGADNPLTEKLKQVIKSHVESIMRGLMRKLGEEENGKGSQDEVKKASEALFLQFKGTLDKSKLKEEEFSNAARRFLDGLSPTSEFGAAVASGSGSNVYVPKGAAPTGRNSSLAPPRSTGARENLSALHNLAGPPRGMSANAIPSSSQPRQRQKKHVTFAPPPQYAPDEIGASGSKSSQENADAKRLNDAKTKLGHLGLDDPDVLIRSEIVASLMQWLAEVRTRHELHPKDKDMEEACRIVLQHGCPLYYRIADVQGDTSNSPETLMREVSYSYNDSFAISKSNRIEIVRNAVKCLVEGEAVTPKLGQYLSDIIQEYIQRINRQNPSREEVATLKDELKAAAMSAAKSQNGYTTTTVLLNAALSLTSEWNERGSYSERIRLQQTLLPTLPKTNRRLNALTDVSLMHTRAPNTNELEKDLENIVKPVWAFVATPEKDNLAILRDVIRGHLSSFEHLLAADLRIKGPRKEDQEKEEMIAVMGGMIDALRQLFEGDRAESFETEFEAGMRHLDELRRSWCGSGVVPPIGLANAPRPN